MSTNDSALNSPPNSSWKAAVKYRKNTAIWRVWGCVGLTQRRVSISLVSHPRRRYRGRSSQLATGGVDVGAPVLADRRIHTEGHQPVAEPSHTVWARPPRRPARRRIEGDEIHV